MKYRLISAALFVLAGAVLNIAVAWGCAAWVRVRQAKAECWLVEGSADYTRAGNLVGVWSRFGADRLFTLWHGVLPPHPSKADIRFLLDIQRFGEILDPRETTAPAPKWSEGIPHYEKRKCELYSHDARGWPLRTLRCVFRISYDTSPTLVTLGGIELTPNPRRAHPWFEPRALPLRPIWANFIVNTLFYGATLWLLIGGPFLLRRLVRRRRGLCPACGYTMGQSSVCTECGSRLPSRAVA